MPSTCPRTSKPSIDCTLKRSSSRADGRDAGRLVARRSPAPVDERGGRRLAQVVADRASITVASRGRSRSALRAARLVDDQQRVGPDVAFGMPLGVLRAVVERHHLRQDSARRRPARGRARSRSTAARRPAAASRTRPTTARTAGRRGRWPGRCARASSSSAHSKRAANCSARSTRRLSSAKVCGSTTRRRRAARSSRPRNGSRYSPVSGSQRDRVDGEVAPPRGVGDATSTDRRRPGIAVCPRPDFDSRRGRATSIGPSLNTGKARPTGSTRPMAASSPGSASLGHTEHFEVEILGVRARAGDRARSRRRPAPGRHAPGRLRRPRWPAPAAQRRRRRSDGSLTASICTPHGDVCQNQPVMTTVHRLLRDLVAIDSVNPTLVPGAAGEAAVAMRLVAGVRGDRRAGRDPGSGAGTAQRRGHARRARDPGRSLMLCGHLDTVGVAGMAGAVHAGERDGRLYGRGIAGHEERRRGDGRCGAGGGRGRRAGRRPGARGLRGRRRALEHRRRRARHPLARRRRASSPSRPISTSPWRTRASSGPRSRPAAAPRTAAGRPTASTRLSTWAACSAASRRSTAGCSPAAATPGWAPRRCTPRPSPADAS